MWFWAADRPEVSLTTDIIVGFPKETKEEFEETYKFLQKINFKEEYDLDKLKELKEKLIMNKIITQEEGKYVNILKAQKFLESNIAKKIKIKNTQAKMAFGKKVCVSLALQWS